LNNLFKKIEASGYYMHEFGCNIRSLQGKLRPISKNRTFEITQICMIFYLGRKILGKLRKVKNDGNLTGANIIFDSFFDYKKFPIVLTI